MSDATQQAAGQPSPQTLSDFQKQVAAEVIARMRAQTDAMKAFLQDQQAKFESQTLELMQSFNMPLPPSATSGKPTGDTGQPPATAQPAAPAGPT